MIAIFMKPGVLANDTNTKNTEYQSSQQSRIRQSTHHSKYTKKTP